MTRQQAHEILQANGAQLRACGVIDVALFGSIVRGENKPDSDLDILIDFDPEKETFNNLMRAYDLLESLFPDHKLDIVTRNGLSPFIGPYILREAQHVQING